MKAIITDLDRTLLRTDKSISEYSLSVLRECKERGILLLAASARPMRTIKEYKEAVGFDAVTAMNGAAVYLPGKEFKFGIPKESGEKILGQF
ncbi:MAG: HAD hydrolase family protein, partial [Clostridia bacterium]|nr:HAD hydrolase family protein [Clostridia bacterium]